MVYTDHKPLTYALLTRSDRYTPRQIRHLDFVSQFNSDIYHVKCADHGPVDALSRLHANTLHVEPNVIIDFKELPAAQDNDTELARQKSSPSSLIFRDMSIPMFESTIVCDVSTDVSRPYVPPSFRCAVFDSLHSLSHPGIRAPQHLVTVLINIGWTAF